MWLSPLAPLWEYEYTTLDLNHRSSAPEPLDPCMATGHSMIPREEACARASSRALGGLLGLGDVDGPFLGSLADLAQA